MPLAVGVRAPDFTLQSQAGEPVRLAALLEKGPVVLYFYPRDETPVCTREACEFRDEYEQFVRAGATVAGISSDSVASHASFAKKHGLPFLLLSDPHDTTRKAFDVSRGLGILPGRVTFVIDADGTVRHAFASQFRSRKHVDEALRIVRGLEAPQGA